MSKTIEDQFEAIANNACHQLEGKPCGSVSFACNTHADGKRSVLIFQKSEDEVKVVAMVDEQIDALRRLLEQHYGPAR